MMERVRNYLASRSFHACEEWISGCVEFYQSEHRNQQFSQSELLDFVAQQWTLADLREISPGCLPPNLARLIKVTLTGKYSLQVEYILNIAQPCYAQLQRIRNVSTENIEISDKPMQSWEPKGKRVLQLHMSDGVQEVKGMEYQPMPCLDKTLVPGTKVILVGPVDCRRGVILLQEHNLKVIGGEIDSLLIPNAVENILARKLNLPENPDPYSHPLATLQSNEPRTAQAAPVMPVETQFPDDDALLGLDDQLSALEQQYQHEVQPSTTVSAEEMYLEDEQRYENEIQDLDMDAFRVEDNFSVPSSVFQSVNQPNKVPSIPKQEKVMKPHVQSVCVPRIQQNNTSSSKAGLTPAMVALREEFETDPFLNSKSSNMQRKPNMSAKQPSVQFIKASSTIKQENLSNQSEELKSISTFQKFKPSPAVANQSIDRMNRLNIVKGDCDAAHSSLHRNNVPQKQQNPYLTKGETSSKFQNMTKVNQNFHRYNKQSNFEEPMEDVMEDLNTQEQESLLGLCEEAEQSFNKDDAFEMEENVIASSSVLRSAHSSMNQPSRNSTVSEHKNSTKQPIQSVPLPQGQSREKPPRPSAALSSLKKFSFHEPDRTVSNNLAEQSKGNRPLLTITDDKPKHPTMNQFMVKKQSDRHSVAMTSSPSDLESREERCGSPVLGGRLVNNPVPRKTGTDTFQHRDRALCEPFKLHSEPFVYLSQLIDRPVDTPTIFTVKAFFLTLVSRLSVANSDSWQLKAKVSDGSAALDVDFSSDVLEKLIGFSPAEIQAMKKDAAKNPLIKAEVTKALHRSQQTLIKLNCLMHIQFVPRQETPCVIEIEEVTSEHEQKLKARLQEYEHSAAIS